MKDIKLAISLITILVIVVGVALCVQDVQQDEFSWSQVAITEDAPAGTSLSLQVLGPVAFGKGKSYNLGLFKVQVIEARMGDETLVLLKAPFSQWVRI